MNSDSNTNSMTKELWYIEAYFDEELIDNPWHTKKLQWLNDTRIRARLLSCDIDWDAKPPAQPTLHYWWIVFLVCTLSFWLSLVPPPKESGSKSVRTLHVTLSPIIKKPKRRSATKDDEVLNTLDELAPPEPVATSRKATEKKDPPQPQITTAEEPPPTASRFSLAEQISEIIDTTNVEEQSPPMGTVFDSHLRDKLNSPEVTKLNTRKKAQPTHYTTITGETIYFSKNGCTRVFNDPIIGEMWLRTKCPSRSEQTVRFGQPVTDE